MSAPVELTPNTSTPGTPQVLLRYSNFSFSALDQAATYDVMTNGDGFVAVQLAGLLEAAGSRESSDTARLNIVLNWFEELERLVPTE